MRENRLRTLWQEGKVADHESLQADEQWTRFVDLEVVFHPGAKQPRAIEADSGLEAEC